MSLGMFGDLSEGSVHIDLLKRFAEENEVWLVCKNEGQKTTITKEYGIHVLRVHTGTLKKVGLIQKGVNTILVEPQFKRAIEKHLSDVCFDLILYTTPPITFASAVKYVKKRDNAFSYLMLKDIFPQNAVDMNMIKTTGIKGIIYNYFRKKEKELYEISDFIGCMSPGNIEYVLKHNPEISPEHVGLCPNSTVVEDMSVNDNDRRMIRNKYSLPLDKKIFVYGGNLGKPQGIPFLIDCLKAEKDSDAFFLIIGQGTDYDLLRKYIDLQRQKNCVLMKRLPKRDYDTLVGACDVGMIFLDHRFTIPNIPSRLLSYMKARIPTLAVTDPNTDLGEIITSGGFGWWCESNSVSTFSKMVQQALQSDLNDMGNNAFDFLQNNYSVDCAYEMIMEAVKSNQ